MGYDIRKRGWGVRNMPYFFLVLLIVRPGSWELHARVHAPRGRFYHPHAI